MSDEKPFAEVLDLMAALKASLAPKRHGSQLPPVPEALKPRTASDLRARIRVSCDTRGCTERLYIIADIARDFDVPAALAEEGWKDLGNDRHACPECSKHAAPGINPATGEPFRAFPWEMT